MLCVMAGTSVGRCRSPPWATVACPGAVGMMGSVAPPVVRHRQQALGLTVLTSTSI